MYATKERLVLRIKKIQFKFLEHVLRKWFEGLNSHRMVEQALRNIIKDHKYICILLISQRQGLGYKTIAVPVETIKRFMLRNDEKAEASEVFEVQGDV